MLASLASLAKNAWSHWCFLFSLWFFWWFPWTPCPQGQWNRFLVIFLHYRTLVFQLPIYASPSAQRSLTFLSRVLATNNLTWMSLAVLSVSHRTTYVRQEVSLPTEQNLSKDQTCLQTHRYSNGHRCVSLAWHPSLHALFWSRQCTSVE